MAKAEPSVPSRRLFFALWPDAGVRGRLQRCQRLLRGRPCRPMRPHNLHLTLVFLGQVGDSYLTQLKALAAGCRYPGFELHLDHLGHWPKPQVAWLGCRQVPEALMALQAELQAGVEALGLPVDRKAFVPHVTLARKLRGPLPDRPITPLSWPVAGFALVQSFTHPEGVVYRPLQHWALGGGAAV